eukprot:COSAG02_NODE_50213_length_322_cov_0.573991_1_plen_64_part_10
MSKWLLWDGGRHAAEVAYGRGLRAATPHNGWVRGFCWLAWGVARGGGGGWGGGEGRGGGGGGFC